MTERSGRSSSTVRIASTNGTVSLIKSLVTSHRLGSTLRLRALSGSIRIAWTSVISCWRRKRLPSQRIQSKTYRREIEKVREKLDKVSREIYSSLTPWQKTLVARHPARPYPLDYILALTMKAAQFAGLVNEGFSSDPDADLATAIKAADRALQLAPDNLSALYSKILVLRAQGNFDGAAALARKAIELNPLAGWFHYQVGTARMGQGRYKDALESYTTAKQLIAVISPNVDQSLANALLANDQFPEAITRAQVAIAEWTTDNWPFPEISWLVLIAAESENGQAAEARAALQKFLATPRTYRSIAEVKKRPELAANQRLLDGLRRAGMPEE